MAGPNRGRHIGARNHLGLEHDRWLALVGHRHQRPSGRAAQQRLGAGLEARATDDVAGPIPLGRERREVLGGHLADVADDLAGERLLRIDPRAVVAVLGPHDASRADDPPTRTELSVEAERAVGPELGEQQLGRPANEPPVLSLDERHGAFLVELLEPVGCDGDLDRHRDRGHGSVERLLGIDWRRASASAWPTDRRVADGSGVEAGVGVGSGMATRRGSAGSPIVDGVPIVAVRPAVRVIRLNEAYSSVKDSSV